MRDTATLERRARWARIALVAVMVTDLIEVWSAMRQIDLLDRAIAGEDIALSAFESDDNRQLVTIHRVGICFPQRREHGIRVGSTHRNPPITVACETEGKSETAP